MDPIDKTVLAALYSSMLDPSISAYDRLKTKLPISQEFFNSRISALAKMSFIEKDDPTKLTFIGRDALLAAREAAGLGTQPALRVSIQGISTRSRPQNRKATCSWLLLQGSRLHKRSRRTEKSIMTRASERSWLLPSILSTWC